MANRRTIRIGILVSSALLILKVFLFFIGSEQRIFSRKHTYRAQFRSASGLAVGNPVQLAGVTVGVVEDIYLPPDPTKQRVQIRISVERKYAARVRLDS